MISQAVEAIARDDWQRATDWTAGAWALLDGGDFIDEDDRR
jgi:hypothetical protein